MSARVSRRIVPTSSTSSVNSVTDTAKVGGFWAGAALGCRARTAISAPVTQVVRVVTIRIFSPIRFFASVCSVLRQELRVPRDFPEVPVGILEVARISAVEGLARRLHDRGAGVARLFHHGVDLASG